MAATKEIAISLSSFIATVLLVWILQKYARDSTSSIIILLVLIVLDAVLCWCFWWKCINRWILLCRMTICSHWIGVVFTAGLALAMTPSSAAFFGLYLIAVSFFHISEFLLTALYNESSLSVHSFLIDHSIAYAVAMVASLLEYAIEYYYIPWIKTYWLISVIGLLMTVSGELLRKVAMVTAGSNFTHQVQYYKRKTHQLVTGGIYSVSRHPSYLGWFYWSIGNQVMLCNPICVVGFAIASWLFFQGRIPEEEEYLLRFFGQHYEDYRQRVGIGIPFIKGYELANC